MERLGTLLYLDFDGALPRNLTSRITWAVTLWGWTLRAIRYDKTKRGWHVVVGIAETLSPSVTVAAQAILGSDYKREAFNLMRVQALADVPPFWSGRWNVLYQSHTRPSQREER